MDNLLEMKCIGCHSGELPLEDDAITSWHAGIPDWTISGRDQPRRLSRVFTFPGFREAMQFANQVGEVAEQEGHHPSLLVEWGKVTVTWWTHATGGLHRNDFIMAAKTDALFRDGQSRAGDAGVRPSKAAVKS